MLASKVASKEGIDAMSKRKSFFSWLRIGLEVEARVVLLWNGKRWNNLSLIRDIPAQGLSRWLEPYYCSWWGINAVHNSLSLNSIGDGQKEWWTTALVTSATVKPGLDIISKHFISPLFFIKVCVFDPIQSLSNASKPLLHPPDNPTKGVLVNCGTTSE